MKTVIELAKQAGFNPVSYMGSNLELFKRFAELVRADVTAEQPAPAQCWKCGDMDSAFQAKCDVPACGMKEQP